jgi:hypothetical protein
VPPEEVMPPVERRPGMSIEPSDDVVSAVLPALGASLVPKAPPIPPPSCLFGVELSPQDAIAMKNAVPVISIAACLVVLVLAILPILLF